MTDKDRPSTWKAYRQGDCTHCHAGCCTMPVEVTAEDLVRLTVIEADEFQHSPKKTVKKLIKAGIISTYRQGTGLFTLTQKNQNGDCYFLNENRLCSVYEKRPEVCRLFPSIGPRPGHCPKKYKKP